MKAAITFAGVLLLAAVVPQPAHAAGLAASSASDPWWPDASAGPAAFGQESVWGLRIPLRVVGAAGGSAEGTPVQVHLDLAQSFVAAGWPSTAGLAGQVLRSFTLDPASLRLLRYTAAWQVLDPEPVPIHLHKGWLEPDQEEAFGRTQSAPFDAQREPLVTVTWLLPESLAAGAVANHYLYLDVAENGQRQSYTIPEQGVEALGRLHWLGAGTLLYGRNVGNEVLDIVAAEDAERIEVRVTRSAGGAFLTDHPLNGEPNPFPLAKGAMRRYNIAGAVDVQVIADRPVVAYLVKESMSNGKATMIPQASGEFIPSLDGGVVGHHFVFPAFAANYDVIVPQVGGGDGDLPDGQASAFCVRVLRPVDALLRDGADCPANALLATGLIDPGDYAFFNVQNTRGKPLVTKDADTRIEVMTVSGRGPVMVQALPGAGANFQYPSTRGSPVGQHFLGSASTAGSLALRSVGEPAWAEAIKPGRQGAPPSSPDPSRLQVVECVGVANGPFCLGPPGFKLLSTQRFDLSQESNDVNDPANPNPHAETAPLAFIAHRAPLVDETDDVEGTLVLRAGGPQAPQSSAVGGDSARVFQVTGPFVVAAFYDDTRITAVTEYADGPVTRTLRLTTNGPVQQLEPATVPTTITADKPIAVLPTGVGSGRALPAMPAFLAPQVLEAQYRGYLIDLVPQGGADPLFINGQPGETLALPFQVRNLGRWNGNPLVDDVSLSITASPADWGGQIAFADGRSTIAGLGSEPVDPVLKLTLPGADSVLRDDGQVTFTVAGKSQHNPNMRSSFTAVVSSRQVYKVEAYFGNVGDPVVKAHAVRVLPGATKEVPFVVHNLGSGLDEFQVSLPPSLIGWQATVLKDGRPVDTLSLGHGASQQLSLRLTAPSAEQTTASLSLPIAIQSVNSASAADTLLVTARLSLAEGLELRSDIEALAVRPGGTARYALEVANTGKAAESVALALSANLPAGWTAAFEQPRTGSFALKPGQVFAVPVLVTAPADAPARLVVPVMVRAEAVGTGAQARDAIGLATVVEAVHDLKVSPLPGLTVRPGGTLELKVHVENHGNGPEGVVVTAAALPGNWTLTAPQSRSALRSGEGVDILVKVRVPAVEAPGPAKVRLAVLAADGQAFPADLEVAVAVQQALAWRPAAPVTLAPGAVLERTLYLQNDGNRDEPVTLDAIGPTGWTVALRDDAFDLARGGVRPVRLTLTAPVAGESAGDVVLTAQAGGEQARLPIPVRVEGQTLAIGDVVAPTQRPAPGTVGFVTVSLRNPTGVAQQAVHVRLLSAQGTLDDVRFASVGPNGTVLAPLRWVHDAGAPPERIEWGLGDGSAYQAIGSQAFAQQESSAGARESPGAALALVVILLALAARRNGGRT